MLGPTLQFADGWARRGAAMLARVLLTTNRGAGTYRGCLEGKAR
jgi:hypothetical protein